MITLLAFIVAIAILVVIHEMGHYWIARLCGVKVLRFSVGFGKTIYTKRFANSETDWVISAIPLGGYVKMLDEREGKVAAHELHLAFNRQPVLQRIAIVVAGPVANLLLGPGGFKKQIAGFNVRSAHGTRRTSPACTQSKSAHPW